MQKSCEEIFELLVDFSDGNLSQEESAEVTGHLEKCVVCQRNLKALEKSLKITKVIWEDTLKDKEAASIAITKKTRKIEWVKYSAIAAAILFAIGIVFLFRPLDKNAGPEPTLDEIKRQIDDEGSSARLLAAADILAKNPETKEIASNQYHFIIKMYPETSSAKIVKSRIQ